jgi:hypothetical protein
VVSCRIDFGNKRAVLRSASWTYLTSAMSAAEERRDELRQETEGERPRISEYQFDNSGDGPLRVPGFSGYAVDVELPPDKRFAHGAQDWAQQRMTAREMEMLRAINHITDQPGWHVAVMDDEDVERLRPHPFAAPLLSDAAWAWCIEELRDKAVRFRADRFTSVFDSGCCVVKSDVLVTRQILGLFQAHLQPLIDERRAQSAMEDEQMAEADNSEDEKSEEEEEDDDDGEDHTGTTVRLIDPGMYPLVYGKTRVLSEGGQVSRSSACEMIGKGEPAPTQPWVNRPSVEELWKKAPAVDSGWMDPIDSKPYLYSHRAQWLPCEVSFRAEEASSTRVQITSYINNLHPVSHRHLYSAIEQAISKSIKPWNEVLVRREAYQKPLRIRTYGVEWQPAFPEWVWDLPALEEQRRVISTGWKSSEIVSLTAADLRPDLFEPIFTKVEDEVVRLGSLQDGDGKVLGPVERVTTSRLHVAPRLSAKLRSIYAKVRKTWQHPEPGAAYSYRDWKAGRADCSVIPPKYLRRDTMADGPELRIPPRPVSLENEFRKSGLQVIVQLASLELEAGQSYSLRRYG